MTWPPADGKAYRPSNGTEGLCFHEGWCDRCRHDAPFREGNPGDSCQIVANALAFDINHAEYPKEWVWLKGEPTCTAFEDAEQPAVFRLTDLESAAQGMLFDEAGK